MKHLHLVAAAFFAISLSAWLGRQDLRTDDTGVLVGLIGLGAFLAAMIEPRRPWIWGLLVPAGVIAVEFWNYFWGTRHAGTGGISGLCAIAVFTITIATAGAYMGRLLARTVSTSARSREEL